TCGLRRQRLAQCLAPRRDEHDQSPFITDSITAQNVDARIVTFDFDVAIIGSVPLVNDVDDADSAFVPTKVAWRHSAIVGMGLDLNAHQLVQQLILKMSLALNLPRYRLLEHHHL